ncbi:MAG: ectoine/hydroxyectoine ABC transporter permease subunit EhuC [bacterium]|nr:ectoine/hydroxyectoine ABC transporter permease subunit EhuC [bacterium]
MDGALDQVLEALPRLWEGTQVTLILSLGGASLAFIVSIALGLADLTTSRFSRGASRVIVEFFRGTSLVVQLFWLFYVMPVLFGIRLSPMLSAILAIGLNYGAYGAEVVRGSINAVARSQWEGAIALSMTPLQRLRRVVWPQAWALMLPGYNNLLIMLVKGTSLASFVTLHDITFVTNQMRRTSGTLIAFGVGLLAYYLIALALSWLLRRAEARAHRRLGRGYQAKSRTDVTAPPGEAAVPALAASSSGEMPGQTSGETTDGGTR